MSIFIYLSIHIPIYLFIYLSLYLYAYIKYCGVCHSDVHQVKICFLFSVFISFNGWMEKQTLDSHKEGHTEGPWT